MTADKVLTIAARSISIVLFSAYSLSSNAQNITNSVLIWEVDQGINLETQQTVVYRAKFRTNGTTSMQWIQKNGERNSAYTVIDTEGSWTDVNQIGSFRYLLRKDDRQVRLRFERNESGLFILFEAVISGSEVPFRQRFRVMSVTPAQ